MVERRAVNAMVVGSNPTRGAKNKTSGIMPGVLFSGAGFEHGEGPGGSGSALPCRRVLRTEGSQGAQRRLISYPGS